MSNLADLLKELEIDIDDNKDNKENEVDINGIKLDDFDDKTKPVIKKMLDTINEQTNNLAATQLVLKTMKEAMPDFKQDDKKVDDKKVDDKKVDDTDPYLKEIKSLKAELENLRNGLNNDNLEAKEDAFIESVKEFTSKNKDIVRYVQEIDSLRAELSDSSKLKYNIEKLYNIAKQSTSKKEESKKKDNTNFVFEQSGINNNSVQPNKVHSLEEAFDLAASAGNSR